MPDTPAQGRPDMDPRELYDLLERFFRGNASNHNIEYRWLAQQSIRLKGLAHDLGVNGIGTFRTKYAVELADLRLAEIEAERGTIAKNDQKLSEEADRLKRQMAC